MLPFKKLAFDQVSLTQNASLVQRRACLISEHTFRDIRLDLFRTDLYRLHSLRSENFGESIG